MKIYMFYFRDKDVNRRLEPVLYAYTNSKEFAERFKEYRNMDKFICYERELTKEQFKDVTRTHPSQQLTETEFVTKDPEFPTKKMNVSIVCTWDEEKAVILESEDSVFRLFEKQMFDPSMLNMDIKGILYKFGFFTIYQYLYNNMYIYNPLEGSEYTGVFFKDAIAGDTIRPVANMQNIHADQLAMFIHLFGGTVK